jgi:hypothetical protein
MEIKLPTLKRTVLDLEPIIESNHFLSGKQALCVSTMTEGVHAFLHLFFEQHGFTPVRFPLEHNNNKKNWKKHLDFIALQTQCIENPVVIVENFETLDKKLFKKFFQEFNQGFLNNQCQAVPVVLSTDCDTFIGYTPAMSNYLQGRPRFFSVNAHLDEVRMVQAKLSELEEEKSKLFSSTELVKIKSLVAQNIQNNPEHPEHGKSFKSIFFKKIFDYLPSYFQSKKENKDDNASIPEHQIQIASLNEKKQTP